MKTIGDISKTNHSYEIGTIINGEITKITVHANSRDSAAKRAQREGFVVRDVNMIG